MAKSGGLRRAAALSCAGALGVGCNQSADPPADVRVAVAVPFAGTGLMADARQAWNLVLEQIEQGGGINGRPLRVYERDTPLAGADDLSPIADGFVALTDEGYRYIISLISGAGVEPIMRAATSRRVLSMSITSEEPAAQLPNFDGLLFRGILPTDRLIEKQAQALQAAGLRSMVSVGPTHAGVPDGRQTAMHAAYASCSSCTAHALTYPAEADLYLYDWRGLGERAVSARPDAVFLAMSDPAALVDAVRAIEVSGYSGNYYFAYGGYMSAVVPAFLGSNVSGRLRSYDLALPPSERLEGFLSLYEQTYGEPFVPEPRLVAFADYLALLALAMTRVGADEPERVAATLQEIAGPPGDVYGPLDFVAAAEAVRNGRDIDFAGLSGPLDFDTRGEVADGFLQEYAVNAAGEIAPVE